MKRILTLILLVSSLLYGCDYFISIEEDNKPQLEIHVFSNDSLLIAGAYVQLFQSLDDWYNKSHLIDSTYTNQDGVALFKELEETVYYFYVTKDSMDNTQGIVYFENPLKKNEIKVLEITIQ